MPGLVLTPFGLGFPICAVGTQSASPTPVSCWGFRWSQKELGEHGTAESWGCPWDGRRSCCSLPLSLVSRSLQTRPQKHKKMPHHIQAAGPLPHSHPSPCVPPSKPWARPSGLSPQGGAIQSSQSGCCRYQPPPQAGALGVARDCGPGSPSLGPLSHRVPLWSHGEQGGKRRRSTAGAPHGRSSRCRVCKRAGTRQSICAASAVGSGPGILILWASLLQVDKSISEITED